MLLLPISKTQQLLRRAQSDTAPCTLCWSLNSEFSSIHYAFFFFKYRCLKGEKTPFCCSCCCLQGLSDKCCLEPVVCMSPHSHVVQPEIVPARRLSGRPMVKVFLGRAVRGPGTPRVCLWGSQQLQFPGADLPHSQLA